MDEITAERFASLEHRTAVLEEKMGRLEQSFAKLEQSTLLTKDKLDSIYPTKESVQLRFEDLRNDVQVLKRWAAENKRRVERLQSWQYKLIGGMGVAVFILGIAVKFFLK